MTHPHIDIWHLTFTSGELDIFHFIVEISYLLHTLIIYNFHFSSSNFTFYTEILYFTILHFIILHLHWQFTFHTDILHLYFAFYTDFIFHICNIHFTFYIVHSRFYILHFTCKILHFKFNVDIWYLTVDIWHWHLNAILY